MLWSCLVPPSAAATPAGHAQLRSSNQHRIIFLSGSDPDASPARAAGRGCASVPAPAQRHSECPVVPVQARHMPGELLDLLGLPLLFLRVLRGQPPQGCRSDSVIHLLHFLDSFTVGRPPTVQGG